MTSSIHISKNRFADYIYWFCLYMFVGVVMIDPANKLLHMKEAAFVLLMFVTLLLQKGRFYRETVVSFVALISLAFLSVFTEMVFFETDVATSLPYFKALLFLTVFFCISKLSIEQLLKFNYIVGLGMAIFISVMLLAFVGGFFDMMSFIMKLADASAVYLARRENLGIEMYMFYYATMPYMFLALIYALRNKHFIPAALIVVAIFYGGSRTPILMAFAVIGYVFYDKRNNKFLKYIIATVVVVAIVYIVYLLTSSTYSQEGDDFKFAVAKYLFNNSSLVGHGVGAPYWDPGRKEVTVSTEVTYFEMLYQYGWLLFPIVLYIFLRPIIKLYKKKNDDNVRDFAVAYLLYLINAGTNPLLISSTGLYVFACALTITAKVHEQQILRSKNITYNFAQ